VAPAAVKIALRTVRQVIFEQLPAAMREAQAVSMKIIQEFSMVLWHNEISMTKPWFSHENKKVGFFTEI